MNQMTTFILLMVGITTLFYVMGIDPNANPLLNILLAPQSMQTTTFWLALSGTLASIGVAFFIGFVSKNAELSIMALVTPILANSLWHFGNVVAIIMNPENGYPILGVLILAPVMYLFAVSLIEYFRGRD